MSSLVLLLLFQVAAFNTVCTPHRVYDKQCIFWYVWRQDWFMIMSLSKSSNAALILLRISADIQRFLDHFSTISRLYLDHISTISWSLLSNFLKISPNSQPILKNARPFFGYLSTPSRIFLEYSWPCLDKSTPSRQFRNGYKNTVYTVLLFGARLFDLTVTSIHVIGPQQLATEQLALCCIWHFTSIESTHNCIERNFFSVIVKFIGPNSF